MFFKPSLTTTNIRIITIKYEKSNIKILKFYVNLELKNKAVFYAMKLLFALKYFLLNKI